MADQPAHPEFGVSDPHNWRDSVNQSMARAWIEQKWTEGHCFHLVLQMGTNGLLSPVDQEILRHLGASVVHIIATTALLDHALRPLDAECVPSADERVMIYWYGQTMLCEECAIEVYDVTEHALRVSFVRRMHMQSMKVSATCYRCHGDLCS